VILVGNIRPYFSPRVVISRSSFLFYRNLMTAHETFLPASFTKLLKICVPLYGLFIMWASLRTSTGRMPIPNFDKVLHAGVYGLLAITISLVWPRLSKFKIGLVCLLYGGVMELAQGALATGRMASFWDFAANGFGIVIALFLVAVLNQKFAK